ncbi:putative NADPH oxidase Respiratory burst [Dioscorea sansibarensis]
MASRNDYVSAQMDNREQRFSRELKSSPETMAGQQRPSVQASPSFANRILRQPSKLRASMRVLSMNARAVPAAIKRLRSSAELGLKGLRFLDKNSGKDGSGWKSVERRFDQFAIDGRLPRETFGRCIGIDKEIDYPMRRVLVLSLNC